jgi:hypothetical protein
VLLERKRGELFPQRAHRPGRCAER